MGTGMRLTARSRCRRGYMAGVAAAISVAAVAFWAAPALATDFTWTGGGPGATALNFSDAANWGGSALTAPIGTLTFPHLADCVDNPSSIQCFPVDDETGLTIGGIVFSNPADADYLLGGHGFTLGSGGFTLTGDSDTLDVEHINNPITLSAPQTWGVSGTANTLNFGENVSGTTDALTLSIPSNQNEILFSADDVEVGPITVNGSTSGVQGILGAQGAQGSHAKLDATDGHTVTVNDAVLKAGNADFGALTLNRSDLNLGFFSPSGGQTMNVAGNTMFGTASQYFTTVNQAGTTAGTDYSQLNVTGNLTLTPNDVFFGVLDAVMPSGGNSECAQMKPGDVDTITTYTGTLSGTLFQAPDGSTVEIQCPVEPSADQPTAQINYGAHAITLTILTAGAAPTITTLTNSPTTPLPNQTVTLTAKVSALSVPAGAVPAGTVAFSAMQTPIAACASQPVVQTSPGVYAATCQVSLPGQIGGEDVEAAFAPTDPSALQGSTGDTNITFAAGEPSSTSLSASNLTPAVGETVTYTATVAPQNPGSDQPTGTVEFQDGGTDIAGCSAQPVGATTATATCATIYPAAGTHAITAIYSGDDVLDGSTSAGVTVTIAALQQNVITTSSSSAPPPTGHTTTSVTSTATHSTTTSTATPSSTSTAPGTVPPPVLYRAENVAPVSGTVLIALPPGATLSRVHGPRAAISAKALGLHFVPLTQARQIPVGSVLDTTRGTVSVTAASATGGPLSTGDFTAGVFMLLQNVAQRGATELDLRDTVSRARACATLGKRASAARTVSTKVLGLLKSTDHGKFSTRGTYSSATVRGTQYSVQDTCAGTLTTVQRGSVAVDYFRRHRMVVVNAGQAFLADANGARSVVYQAGKHAATPRRQKRMGNAHDAESVASLAVRFAF